MSPASLGSHVGGASTKGVGARVLLRLWGRGVGAGLWVRWLCAWLVTYPLAIARTATSRRHEAVIVDGERRRCPSSRSTTNRIESISIRASTKINKIN